MKKVLFVSLALLMCITLSACKSKDKELLGGYTEAKDQTVTAELQAKFDKALEGLEGVNYTAKKLIGTQVVAGTNYKFLCDAKVVVPDAKTEEKIVIVYEDLQGNCSVLDVLDVK